MEVKDAYSIPPPDDQLLFFEFLLHARGQVLQDALLDTVTRCDLATIDTEAHQYAPADALLVLAGKGLRAELVFCLPTILRANPRLLGYYRLLLGFSQKSFYTKPFGLSGKAYMTMEQQGVLLSEVEKRLPDLCIAINQSSAHLVRQIGRDQLTRDNLRDLALLTFGPQLRGSRNVRIGVAAVAQTFELIREIIEPFIESSGDRVIRIRDSTGRQISIRFSSDPDVEIVTRTQRGAETPILAIEVKGGRDYSNVHNRLGEAEKSHIKAKSRGFTDLWTITNVTGLADRDRKQESPTTTKFFDLEDLLSRSGDEYEGFRESLCQKLRLPPADPDV